MLHLPPRELDELLLDLEKFFSSTNGRWSERSCIRSVSSSNIMTFIRPCSVRSKVTRRRKA